MNCIRSLTDIGRIISLAGNHRSFANYALRNVFKTDLKIKWVHPGKISCISQEKSGDLDRMPVIDNKQFQYEFKDCKELEDANDMVKKLFSLEFAPRRKATQIYIKSIADKVRRHQLDLGSVETRIARWTGCIRAFQETMDMFPRNKVMKVNLKELIEKRKKLLKRLRKWDYKRFEWLIDNLNIVYKPEPLIDKTFTRKSSMVKLTDKYCEDTRNERLNKYKLQLEAEQPAFLKEKIALLEFIRKEQMECGVEVTISQEEIHTVKKELQELLIKCEKDLPKEE